MQTQSENKDTQTADKCFTFKHKRKKEMEFLQLTGFSIQNFLDPAQVFGYVHIDVGDVRVVTVMSHVE